MKWLNVKTGGLASASLVLFLLLIGFYSSCSTNRELKQQLADKQKESEEAKKRAADTNAQIAALQDSFSKKLEQQSSLAQAQIQQLQAQLSVNNAVRLVAQNTYNQQSAAIKTQLGQVSSASGSSLVQTVSAELKVPTDSFNVMTDRVQVGNDSFRAIAQRIVECKEISAENALLTTQSETYKKDNDSQAQTITNLTAQIQSLISSQKQHDNDVQSQIAALNKSYQDQLSAKDAQVAILTKELKKERSFFGNLKRSAQKIAMGVVIGLGIGAAAGL